MAGGAPDPGLNGEALVAIGPTRIGGPPVQGVVLPPPIGVEGGGNRGLPLIP